MPKEKDKNSSLDAKPEEIVSLIERAERGTMSAEDQARVSGLLRLLLKLVWVTKAKDATVGKLRSLLFGKKTERRDESKESKESTENKESKEKPEKKDDGSAKRHGRRGSERYDGATETVVTDERLRAGGPCPELNCGGRLFDLGKPNTRIVLEGRPTIDAMKYVMPVFVCSRCRVRVATPTPEQAREKYSPGADVALALARFGMGLPHDRLERTQANLGVPIAASVQWQRVALLAETLLPVYLACRKEAARAKVLFQDDTRMTVLSEDGATRTTGLVAQTDTYSIALYLTGRKHAGENVADLLLRRPNDLDDILRMGDALSQNWICEKGVIGKCLVHARRQFFDIRNSFPDECTRVLDAIGAVYRVEAETKDLSDEDRLKAHQEKSGPVLAHLRTWIDEQLAACRIEPNSILGKACAYLQRHWTHLTQFLRVPGMPLDSNPSERALKQAIVHRKNSLFYKTSIGATVGDILQSLIQTCRLNGVNAWSYLMAVRRSGPEAVRTDPSAWLPWRWAASPG